VSTVLEAASGAPALEFVGGDPSLDLVNTADWEAEGLVNERLTSYERLIQWAEGAEVLSRSEAAVLRRSAAGRPAEAAAALARAHGLRSLLRRLFCEVADGRLSEATCDEFDELLASALGRLGLTRTTQSGRDSPPVRWRWRDAGDHLDSLLWPVAWSAAKLLASNEARSIRVCAGPDCGWVYVDRSRNGLRRWCQMKTCGTAAKTRRRRSRDLQGDRSRTAR